MTVPHMLRVKPHESVGELPVPMPGGKAKWLTKAKCPPDGYLVEDSMHVRRRIMFKELVLVSEGKAALPVDPKPAAAATPIAAPATAPTPAALAAEPATPIAPAAEPSTPAAKTGAAS